MRKIIIILSIFICVAIGQDSTFGLEPSEEYIELTNNRFSDGITGIRSFIAPDSNGGFSPKKAMLFSMVMPGFGHLYVRKPVKALFYLSAEVYSIQQAWHFNDQLKNIVNPNKKLLQEKIGMESWYSMSGREKTDKLRDSTDYNLNKGYWRPEEQRNKRIWWCAGIYIMAMLDCYVDAHLSDFPVGDLEFINDTKIKSNGLQFSIPIEGIKND